MSKVKHLQAARGSIAAVGLLHKEFPPRKTAGCGGVHCGERPEPRTRLMRLHRPCPNTTMAILAARKVLLVAEVLICRHEHLETLRPRPC